MTLEPAGKPCSNCNRLPALPLVSVELPNADCNEALPGLCPNKLFSSAASCAASVFDGEFGSELVAEPLLELAPVDVSEPVDESASVLVPLLELAVVPTGAMPGGGGGADCPGWTPLACSVWLMAPKTACKTVARSLLSVVSLVALLVEAAAVVVDELLVELLLELEELLFPSNALMMACSICWRRSDVVEPLLDDAPLPLASAPELPSQPPTCCVAASDWADDAGELLLLCDCSRMMIKALLEPLAPLIADMGNPFRSG